MSEIFDSSNREESVRAEKPRERGSRPGIFWPLLLISLGVLFLLRNTGYMEDDTLGLVFRLWPVIFIIGALDELFRGHGIVGPGFWITVGVILIMANFGLLAWDALSIILYLWPLILVALGLELLTRKLHFLVKILALVVIVGLVVSALFFLGTSRARAGSAVTQDLDGVSEVNVRLEPVAGLLQVDGMAEGEAGDLLVSGSIPSSSDLTSDFDTSASSGTYSLKRSRFPVAFNTGSGGGWHLSFTPLAELDLNTDMAVGEVEYDLTGLQVSGFDIDMAMGSVEVTLPEEGSFEGSVNFAMGMVEILVPEDLGVRVRSDGAIVDKAYPDDFTRDGDYITSPGYEDAENKVDIRVNLAIGRIVVRTIAP